jgi:hypothetical protein
MEVGLLILGWLFGLLTTPIANEIERRRDRSRISRTLANELSEVQRRMALISYGVSNRNGALTIEQLRWTATIVERGDTVAEYQRLATNMRGIADNGPEQLAALNEKNLNEKRTFNLIQDFRFVEAPFLAAHLDRLTLFSERLCHQLWWCDAQLRLYRELVDEGREYFRMTLDPNLTGQNRQIVQGSLHRSESNVGNRARIIAQHIDGIAFSD